MQIAPDVHETYLVDVGVHAPADEGPVLSWRVLVAGQEAETEIAIYRGGHPAAEHRRAEVTRRHGLPADEHHLGLVGLGRNGHVVGGRVHPRVRFEQRLGKIDDGLDRRLVVRGKRDAIQAGSLSEHVDTIGVVSGIGQRDPAFEKIGEIDLPEVPLDPVLREVHTGAWAVDGDDQARRFGGHPQGVRRDDAIVGLERERA